MIRSGAILCIISLCLESPLVNANTSIIDFILRMSIMVLILGFLDSTGKLARIKAAKSKVIRF
ncbi:MAG: hypothetical protein ACRCYE_07890 [Sarcina sp.]